MTTQTTITGDKVKRTKFFFGYRYIWSRIQLNEPHSFVGAGIRCDVSRIPSFMPNLIVKKLEDYNIAPKVKNFLIFYNKNINYKNKK